MSNLSEVKSVETLHKEEAAKMGENKRNSHSRRGTVDLPDELEGEGCRGEI